MIWVLLVAGAALAFGMANRGPASSLFGLPPVTPGHVYNVSFILRGGGSGIIPDAVLGVDWGELGIVRIGSPVVTDATGRGTAQVMTSPLVLAPFAWRDTSLTHWTGVVDLGVPAHPPPPPIPSV